jgi:hypothetical protein
MVVMMPTTGSADETGTSLIFDVPPGLPDATASTVELKVQVPGKDELTLTLPVDQPRIRSAWREDCSGTVAVAAVGWRSDNSASGTAPRVLANGRSCLVDDRWKREPNEPLLATLPSDLALAENLIRAGQVVVRTSTPSVQAPVITTAG